MDAREILEQVKTGALSVEEAEGYFRRQPFEEYDYAKLDSHRAVRCGFPEVIFCQGKPDAYLPEIYRHMMEIQGEALGTRASKHQYELVKKAVPDVSYDPVSHILKMEKPGKIRMGEFFGAEVDRIYDVGVSGLHRLLAQLDRIQKANCVVAVAGMEGALASVIGGLVSNPVIAVPTSVGYGASMHGISALLTMINSCANGVAVVNIDNGYGAGYMAAQINRLAVCKEPKAR